MAVTRSQSRTREPKVHKMILFTEKPLTVVKFASMYIFKFALKNIGILAIMSSICALIYSSDNPLLSNVKFNIYWFILGIASSIGFGSGLHTFLLYLGPHIVHLTHYAHKCGLPDNASFNLFNKIAMNCNKDASVTFWEIFLAVAVNSFFWGVGTAVGELPPYFIAKTDHKAKEELKDIKKLMKKSKLTTVEYIKVNLYHVMKNYGFLGILLCASVHFNSFRYQILFLIWLVFCVVIL